MTLRRLLPLLALATAATAHSQIRLPKLISDHAVLQRDRPIHLWGYSTPGAHLTATFHKQSVSAETNPLGKWSLYLAPEPAGGPYTLQITGDGTQKVEDLLVGDVWFASGQSNMEIPLSGFGGPPGQPPSAVIQNAEKEIASATNPRIRFLVVEKKSSDFPLNDISTTWTTCTPETAKNFSAVAYFFGRELASKENVPIGLIDSTWGGTPADPWISLDTLGTNPALLPAFASRARFVADYADDQAKQLAEQKEDAAARAAGKPVPGHMWHPNQASWLPAGLFNAMVAPFTPLTFKGVIWYQGETNSGHDRAPYYQTLFSALIGDWRAHFQQGNFPFLYVQISSFNSPGEDWGLLRDQQRRTLDVANTAMAVTLDVGLANNVHPPDKQTVAARLAAAARTLVYGEHQPYQGPTFREATTEQLTPTTTALRVWFDHAEGLTRRTAPDSGFELAGPDHKFTPAQSRIEGQTVLVTSPTVLNPTYVRYGWSSVVTDFLYNTAGLPTSTFTSEPNPAH